MSKFKPWIMPVVFVLVGVAIGVFLSPVVVEPTSADSAKLKAQVDYALRDNAKLRKEKADLEKQIAKTNIHVDEIVKKEIPLIRRINNPKPVVRTVPELEREWQRRYGQDPVGHGKPN